MTSNDQNYKDKDHKDPDPKSHKSPGSDILGGDDDANEWLRQIVQGDTLGALRKIEEQLGQAETDEDRARLSVARLRLLGLRDPRGEREGALEQLAALAEQLGEPERAPVLLELAAARAESGDLESAREALSQIPADAALPDDAVAKAVQKVSALAALSEAGDAPFDANARALLSRVSPVTRATTEANLLLAEGRQSDARELLETAERHARRDGQAEVRAGLLLQLSLIDVIQGSYEASLRHLRDARDEAVKARDPLLYAVAAALLAAAYATADDKVNAYAVAIRGLVSLEDLLGEGAGLLFANILKSFRKAWGTKTYEDTAKAYVERRKKGAIS
jgi:hypothetical protein